MSRKARSWSCRRLFAECRPRIDPIVRAGLCTGSARLRCQGQAPSASGETGKPARGACRRTESLARERAWRAARAQARSPGKPRPFVRRAAGSDRSAVDAAERWTTIRAEPGPPRRRRRGRALPRSMTSSKRNRCSIWKRDAAPRSLAHEFRPSRCSLARRLEQRPIFGSDDRLEKARIWTSPSQSTPGLSGSASSRTQWKLVPPKPNATHRRAARMPGAGSQGRPRVAQVKRRAAAGEPLDRPADSWRSGARPCDTAPTRP